MNKHTQGPWEVDLETGEITAEGPVVLGAIYGADDFPCNENDITEECNANARLIAAAPEMLKALEEIAEGGEDGNCTCEMGEGYHAIYCPIGIATIARAAIAKAKGEQ